MHEVEVKARVTDLGAVIASLAEQGCVLSPVVEERDTLYARVVGTLDEYNRNADFLRIRERGDGKVIFTLKHHPERHEGRPDSMPLEHETEIGSRDEMEHALLLMGYHEAVRVSKVRRKGRFGKWEVCLDEVEGLGAFIELEELTDGKETGRVMEEMRAFLRALGIPEEDLGADRYDIALLKARAKGILASSLTS